MMSRVKVTEGKDKQKMISISSGTGEGAVKLMQGGGG